VAVSLVLVAVLDVVEVPVALWVVPDVLVSVPSVVVTVWVAELVCVVV
jgi:hypothetical protein